MDDEDEHFSAAAAAIAELRRERLETLSALLPLTDEQCSQRLEWWGQSQTVNQRLRAFTAHALDHYQHLHRLLQARGRMITEAQLLMIHAHATLGQFEALVLALTDEEFDAVGPNDGDWSARQILQHVIDQERAYRENIVGAIGASSR